MAMTTATDPSPSARTAHRVGDDAPVEERIVAAGVRCVARWGLAKTTLDDIAREAGCSRATIYRTFPGGKDTLLRDLLGHEVRRFFDLLDAHLAGQHDLDEVVTEAVAFALRQLRGHEALATLLAQEPEVILPQLVQGHLDGLLAVVQHRIQPHLSGHLPVAAMPLAAELLTRVVLSVALRPSPHFDLSDPHDVRRLVHTFVLPSIHTLQGDL